MAPRQVLICGFGPFPGVPNNPSAIAARRLGALRNPALADLKRTVLVLPTCWSALELLGETLRTVAPDAVLLLGVAGRRRRVDVETRAVNAASAFPDAARRHFPARKLLPGAPDALRTDVPAAALVAAVRSQGLACGASRDAGRYLCNGAYFTALEAMAGRAPVVFVHLPGRGPVARAITRPQGIAALARLLVALARGESLSPANKIGDGL